MVWIVCGLLAATWFVLALLLVFVTDLRHRLQVLSDRISVGDSSIRRLGVACRSALRELPRLATDDTVVLFFLSDTCLGCREVVDSLGSADAASRTAVLFFRHNAWPGLRGREQVVVLEQMDVVFDDEAIQVVPYGIVIDHMGTVLTEGPVGSQEAFDRILQASSAGSALSEAS